MNWNLIRAGNVFTVNEEHVCLQEPEEWTPVHATARFRGASRNTNIRGRPSDGIERSRVLSENDIGQEEKLGLSNSVKGRNEVDKACLPREGIKILTRGQKETA